jgi:hypothetical protein
MNPLDWATVVSLILTQGLPVAERIWTLANTNAAPTKADWDALMALSKVNARGQMMLALARAGIAPDSEQGKAFLALTP